MTTALIIMVVVDTFSILILENKLTNLENNFRTHTHNDYPKL